MTDASRATADTGTIQVIVAIESALAEVLISEMDDLGFQTFETHDERVTGYVPAIHWNAAARSHLLSWLSDRVVEVSVIENVIPQENWNATWEATIEPVIAGDFIVLPSWKEVPADAANLTPIWIDPKMSFGTGHHETTRLMLQLMSDLELTGKSVLDAGTGTGVLAIAAALLKAQQIYGFDIDPWSIENGAENVAANEVTSIRLEEGSIEVARGNVYDVILANIVQNVIESFLPDFAGLLRPAGDLLVSGILREGEEKLLGLADDHGFDLLERRYENEWVGFHFRRAQ